MNKKLEYKNFDLQKVKVNNKKGVVINFYDLTQRNDLLTVDSDSVPHEDFFNALGKLKEVFCKSLGLHTGWEFAREHNRKNEEALKLAINEYNSEVERCNVTGFSLVCSGEREGVKITGSLECELGTVGLSSPIIRFDEEEVGVGDLACLIVDEIKEELWAFIYKGKRANDLFSQEVTEPIVESGLNNIEMKAV